MFRKLSKADIESLRKEFAVWEGSKAELGEKYGISKASLYRLAKDEHENTNGVVLFAGPDPGEGGRA